MILDLPSNLEELSNQPCVGSSSRSPKESTLCPNVPECGHRFSTQTGARTGNTHRSQKRLHNHTRTLIARILHQHERWPAAIANPFGDPAIARLALTAGAMPVQDSALSLSGILADPSEGADMDDLPAEPAGPPPAPLPDRPPADPSAAAAFYVAHSRAKGTFANRNSSWRTVLDYCERESASPLPMSDVVAANFVAHLADLGRTYSTIRNILTTIRGAHRAAKFPDPTRSQACTDVFDGVARLHGKEPKNQKKAILGRHLLAIVENMKTRDVLRATLELAVILLTFFASFRCQELVSIDIPDLTFVPDGLQIILDKSKTNQHGAPELVTIKRLDVDHPLCCVRAIERWLKLLGATSGPLFRSIDGGDNIMATRMCDKTVSRMIKRYAAAVGIHESQLASTSMRAGTVTQLIMDGVSDTQTALITRRRSLESLQIYYRPGPDDFQFTLALK